MSEPQAMPRICIGSLIALGLSAWLGSACAMSRIGEAEVRLQDGQPCFTISEKEAKRGPSFLLQAVILSDSSTKPVNTVWSMAPDLASSMKMSAANCIVYGQTLDGATASPASAPVLQPGRVYRVYLNTRSSDPSDPTRGQDASFCLMADQTGGRRLVQVKYGMRAWDTGFCE